MATYGQLIGFRKSVEEIRQHIAADTLAYLSLEGLIAAVEETSRENPEHCTACFSGNYPVRVPEWLFEEDREKPIFEGMWG